MKQWCSELNTPQFKICIFIHILLQLEGISTADLLSKKRKGADVNVKSADLFTPLDFSFEKNFFNSLIHNDPRGLNTNWINIGKATEWMFSKLLYIFNINKKLLLFFWERISWTNFINVFQRSFVTITIEKGCLQVWQ